MMISLVAPIREDTCLKCGGLRSVELYDISNHPTRYTFLIDSGNTDKLLEKKLSHFQCRKCKEIYSIDWKNRTFPKPLSYTKKMDFMRAYQKK